MIPCGVNKNKLRLVVKSICVFLHWWDVLHCCSPGWKNTQHKSPGPNGRLHTSSSVPPLRPALPCLPMLLTRGCFSHPHTSQFLTQSSHPSSTHPPSATSVSFSSPSSIYPDNSSQQAFYHSVNLINKKILLPVCQYFWNNSHLPPVAAAGQKIHLTLCLFGCLRISPSSVIAQLIGVICFELFL